MRGASHLPSPPGLCKALVAEDDSGDRWSFSDTLRSRGYSVVSCGTCDAAWSAFLEDPPAVVILDLPLPGMDGAELCLRIRAHALERDPVIMAVAGRDDSGELASCVEAGADDFIRRPVDPLLFDARMTLAERRMRERSERTSARRALESKTHELEILFRSRHHVFFSADLTHDRLIQVSGAATVLFGHTPEELVSDRTLWKRFLLPPSGEQDPWRQLLERRSPEPVVSEHTVMRRDGSTRWVRATLGVESRTLEGIVQVDGMVTDVTLEREAHIELAERNEELESFAYSVSHDLRAPLRTMQGFAHALLQDFGDRLEPAARDYARRIIVSGQRSEALIRDLLAYSRLSLEQLELKPVELAPVVAAAREQVDGDVTLTGARVQVTGALPTVVGSHTILVQVLANLISNAVKFVPESRDPRVRIHTEGRPDRRVRVWVEDNGIGVPEDQRERIFGVFERLEYGGAHPGTGIGLAIVRRGMQRIGGSCGVTSVPGEGSAFWIELPEEPGRLR